MMRGFTTTAAIFTLATMACSGAEDGRGSTGPEDGAWEGERISFELQGSTLSGFVLSGITCAGEGCTKGLAVVHADGEISRSERTFEGSIGDVAITGEFVSDTEVTGTWTLLPDSCCNATGTWSAVFVPGAPVDTGDGDTGGTTDGATDGVVEPGTGEPLPPGEYLVPEDATEAQKAAMERTNWYRANVGLPAIDNHSALNQAAQAHADYYALHVAEYQAGKIPGGAHSESADIPKGYTGENFGERASAAGYTGALAFEVMAFLNSPAAAVDGWIETLYHRIPFVSPDIGEAGYGGAVTVDVMDFGRRAFDDKERVVLYPWPGQTDVPRSWDGAESPQPPVPDTGYPSGPIITATTSEGAPLDITVHQLLDANGQEIPHVWHPRGSNGFMSATWSLYAHDPLPASETFTVVLEGTHGAGDWSRTWTFTTRP